MTEFFDVRNPDGEHVWLAAREGSTERRVFVWVANTGAWHWNDALQADFYAAQPDMDFIPLTSTAAAAASLSEAKINQVTGRIVLEALLGAPTASSAELGLPIITPQQPTRDPRLLDALRRDPHTWVVVRSYPALPAAPARTLASEIRTGKKKSLLELGQLEARVRQVGDQHTVEIRVAPLGGSSLADDVPDGVHDDEAKATK